jgi:mRNA interferase RelE/StbE
MWKVKFSNEARNDIRALDNSLKKQVFKGIAKVSTNPLPQPAGYGNPIGNNCGSNLTKFFKIKYKDKGIGVIYTLAFTKNVMNIVVVVSQRDDEYCYNVAKKLYDKYGEEVFKDIFDELK